MTVLNFFVNFFSVDQQIFQHILNKKPTWFFWIRRVCALIHLLKLILVKLSKNLGLKWKIFWNFDLKKNSLWIIFQTFKNGRSKNIYVKHFSVLNSPVSHMLWQSGKVLWNKFQVIIWYIFHSIYQMLLTLNQSLGDIGHFRRYGDRNTFFVHKWIMTS